MKNNSNDNDDLLLMVRKEIEKSINDLAGTNKFSSSYKEVLHRTNQLVHLYTKIKG